MMRAATVFGCVVASGAFSVEPNHALHVSQMHQKAAEGKHAETKKAVVTPSPKETTKVKKVAAPPHHDHEVKAGATKVKSEKKHSSPVALSRKTVAIKPLDPKLTPESDEKFMKGDYPYDNRPKVTEKFEGVYPKMQSTKKYESDYVKDDNNDGGHWAAQMKYDELKNKLAAQRQKTKEALAKEQEERKDHEEASEEHKEEQQKAVEAEKEALAAEKEADEAEKELEEAEKADKEKKDKEPENLAAAEAKVEKAQLNLKGCEKKLEDAQKELAQMKNKQQGGSAEKAVAKKEMTAEEKAAAKERAEADKATAAAEAERKKANEEEVEHVEAKKEYKAEKKEEEKIASDLEKAEAELRKLRGEEPKKNSVAEEKSGAASFAPMMVVAGAVCLTALK